MTPGSQTRLSKPPTGERNFHVLYQLVAARSKAGSRKSETGRLSELVSSLELPWQRPEELVYLQSDAWSAAEARRERTAFARTCACLESLGVSKERIGDLWSMLSTVRSDTPFSLCSFSPATPRLVVMGRLLP